MSVTLEDYERAIEGFARELARLGDSLVSVYLYGSAARGTVKPGTSDLDFDVYLRRGVFEDREAFLDAVKAMVGACGNIASSGVRYEHPCAYWADDELRYLDPAFLPSLLSGKESRLIAGSDIRGRFPDPVILGSSALNEMLYYVYSLSSFLKPGELTPQERAGLVGGIDFTRKVIPQFACGEAGEPAVWEEAPRTLARLFPDIDLSVLEDAAALRDAGDAVLSAEELKRLLRRCLVLIEELRQRTAGRKRKPSQSPVKPLRTT